MVHVWECKHSEVKNSLYQIWFISILNVFHVKSSGSGKISSAFNPKDRMVQVLHRKSHAFHIHGLVSSLFQMQEIINFINLELGY